MKSFLPFCLIASLLVGVSGCAHAPLPLHSSGEPEAIQAAKTWLALADSEKYAESWETASALFKKAVTPQDWRRAMEAVRVPLGKLVSRKLKSAEYKTALPGAPDGEYVVIQFETVFENKKGAVETVTPMKEKDGVWRVSGYFIK